MMNSNDVVAISYAQGNEEYNEKIIGFVNLLREEYGYNVIMDQMYKQEETAVDFNEMMSKLISNSNKVIVILSTKYKQRADDFDGGVGREYRIILDEIVNKPKKYIFVTFDSLEVINTKDIMPSALGNREIIDLIHEKNKLNTLLSKLSDKPIYQFSEVAKNKKLPTQHVIQFKSEKNKRELLKKTQILLAESKQILEQYGPDSLVARKKPLSPTVKTWNEVKTDILIPNNRKIIQEFEKNISILTIEEIRIYKKFKIHADAFEKCQKGLIEREAVPRFPEEFEKMINKEDYNAWLLY